MPTPGVLLIALAAFVAGCAARRDPAGETPDADGLCIDGLMIDGGALSLLEVLASHVRTRQWLDTVQPGSPGPLVLVNGREVDGLERLAAISAGEVQSVESVDPDMAVAEYGPRGRDGAIVIATRSDFGHPSAPYTHLPQRCH